MPRPTASEHYQQMRALYRLHPIAPESLQTPSDFLRFIESKLDWARLDAVLQQAETHSEKEIVERLCRLLAERWQRILERDVAYPHDVSNPANQVYLTTADWLSSHLNQSIYALLMPTLKINPEDDIVDGEDLTIKGYILSDDNHKLIHIPSCLDSAIEDTQLKDFRDGAVRNLTEQEKHRLLNQAPIIRRCYELIQYIYQAKRQPTQHSTLLLALIEGLRAGANRATNVDADEYNASAPANEAIATFSDYLESLPQDEREKLMGTSNGHIDIRTVWERLARENDTDYEDPHTCVNSAADDLEIILNANPWLASTSMERLEQQLKVAREAVDAEIESPAINNPSCCYGSENDEKGWQMLPGCHASPNEKSIILEVLSMNITILETLSDEQCAYLLAGYTLTDVESIWLDNPVIVQAISNGSLLTNPGEIDTWLSNQPPEIAPKLIKNSRRLANILSPQALVQWMLAQRIDEPELLYNQLVAQTYIQKISLQSPLQLSEAFITKFIEHDCLLMFLQQASEALPEWVLSLSALTISQILSIPNARRYLLAPLNLTQHIRLTKQDTARVGTAVQSFRTQIRSNSALTITPQGFIIASPDVSHLGSFYEMQNPQLAFGFEMLEPRTGKSVRNFIGHRKPVKALAITSQGQIVSGSQDTTIKVWDPESGRCLRTFRRHADCVFALAITPQNWIVSASQDNTTIIWDPVSARYLRTLRGHTDFVRALAITPQGQIVTGSEDTTIRIWDPVSGRCLSILKGHRGPVYTLAITSQGLIVSGSQDTSIKIWDPVSGRCLRTLNGHRRAISTLLITPQGVIVSNSADKITKIWDPQGNQLIQSFTEDRHKFRALAITPQGFILSQSDCNILEIRQVAPLFKDDLHQAITQRYSIRELLALDGRCLQEIETCGMTPHFLERLHSDEKLEIWLNQQTSDAKAIVIKHVGYFIENLGGNCLAKWFITHSVTPELTCVNDEMTLLYISKAQPVQLKTCSDALFTKIEQAHALPSFLAKLGDELYPWLAKCAAPRRNKILSNHQAMEQITYLLAAHQLVELITYAAQDNKIIGIMLNYYIKYSPLDSLRESSAMGIFPLIREQNLLTALLIRLGEHSYEYLVQLPNEVLKDTLTKFQNRRIIHSHIGLDKLSALKTKVGVTSLSDFFFLRFTRPTTQPTPTTTTINSNRRNVTNSSSSTQRNVR